MCMCATFTWQFAARQRCSIGIESRRKQKKAPLKFKSCDENMYKCALYYPATKRQEDKLGSTCADERKKKQKKEVENSNNNNNNFFSNQVQKKKGGRKNPHGALGTSFCPVTYRVGP